MSVITIPIIFALAAIATVLLAYKWTKKERRLLLEKLWKEKKIDDDTYKEYLDK